MQDISKNGKFEVLVKYGLIAFFIAMPVILFSPFWSGLFNAGKSHAWDGTGHYGIAELYRNTIFPDVFGWSYNFFEGMAVPNYYPPLFYWLVSLVSQIFDFDTAFKLVVSAPMLLMPGLIWLLAWKVSNKNIYAASWSVIGLIVLLIDPRANGSQFHPSGLDYHSTYIIGLYSQPLGMVLLICWYIFFRTIRQRTLHFVLATVFLSLTVLANVFSIFLVSFIAFSILITDFVGYLREKDAVHKKSISRNLRRSVLSLFISAGLTCFWTIPMLSTYRYVVTLPFDVLPLSDFLYIWYAVAALGGIYWLATDRRDSVYYMLSCSLLAVLIFVFPFLSLPWIPLQSHRLWSSFNFLLSVPFGLGIVFIFKTIFLFPFWKLKTIRNGIVKITPYVFAAWLVFFAVAAYWYTTTPIARLYTRFFKTIAFYPYISPDEPLPKPRLPRDYERDTGDLSDNGVTDNELDTAEGIEDIEQILRFARENKDAMFYVAFGNRSSNNEGRAINHYLGAQGNKTFLSVFREASINALFVYPQANAFAESPDSFGLSSVLDDDLGFPEQDVTKHLNRINFLGGKFLITNTKKLKDALDTNSLTARKAECGNWTIYEILKEVKPQAFELVYKPALIFTDFTVKKRKVNDGNYIRYAEEQFSGGDFDVQLAFLPDSKPEDFENDPDLNGFGALILDNYNCGDCDKAFRVLQNFSKDRLLVLLESSSPLFTRIRENIRDFPKASIIARRDDNPGEWINTIDAQRTSRFADNEIRKQWSQIQDLLNQNKVGTNSVNFDVRVENNRIRVDPQENPAEAVPVVIRNTFHPNWKRTDGMRLYLTSPVRTLTFVKSPTELTFRRRTLDYLGIIITLLSLFGLIFFIVKFRKKLPKNSFDSAEA